MTLEPSSLGDARPLQLEDFTSQRQGEAGPPEGDREGAALLHSPTGGESEGGGGLLRPLLRTAFVLYSLAK